MSRKLLISSAISAIIGLSVGYAVWSNTASTPTNAPSQEQEIDYWVAPMDQNYRREKPGKSPMGMDLIPVYKGDGDKKSDVGFTISPNVLASLGVKTAQATKEVFAPVIHATGQTTYDERLSTRIQIRSEGWVEILHVKAVGEFVQKGKPLFSYYSHEIASALSEYMQIQTSGRTQLKKIALSRLLAFGLSEKSIADAAGSNNPHKPINVYANRGGIVTKLGIRDGSYVGKNTVAFEITDISNMWLIAEIFASKAKNIKVGQEAVLSNKTKAVVDYIYPDVDPKLQTVRLRLNLSNSTGEIKAGEYMSLKIHPEGQDELVVPDTAVIRLGNSARVIVSHGEGKFEAAEVIIGASDGGKTVILSGLNEGEKVVISGQFMLDSESSFKGAAMRMTDKTAEPTDPVETEVTSMGTINSVDVHGKKVNITHPEIPEIGWPTMMMDFDVVNAVDLSVVKPQAKVHFGIGKNAEGMYVVTSIHVIENPEGDMK